MGLDRGGNRRVAVTGIGLITPLGQGADSTWRGLLDGRSAVAPIEHFDASALESRLAAVVEGFAPVDHMTKRELRTLVREDQFALAAAGLALKDAGIDVSEPCGARAGVFLGGDKETSRMGPFIDAVAEFGREDGDVDMHRLGKEASSVINPLFYIEGLQPAAVFHISKKFGMRGANAYFHGTADSGAMAVGRAARSIMRGESGTALCGGSSVGTSSWMLAKTDAAGFTTTRNDLGAGACKPFDAKRTGSVLGEGAALLHLEEYESALARGARVYAEITGFGSGNECARIPAPDPDGRGLSRALSRAMDESHWSEVDFVTAHGSATRSGDLSEARALHKSLGPRAGHARVTSVKPQTGHLAAGAGALNAAVAALSLREGVVPPTINVDDPDPECDLNLALGADTAAAPRTALAVGRGVEGQAVALALTAART